MIDPLKLVCHRGTWYLVAWCHLRKARRLFALHRVQNYELTEEHFQSPDPDELKQWTESPLFLEHREPDTEVKVKFDAPTARYIKERKWHPTQQLVEHADGSCTLTFISVSLDEVKRWLLSFGAGAHVIAPVELQDAIQSELRNCLEQYS